jgi:hypothetical protein
VATGVHSAWLTPHAEHDGAASESPLSSVDGEATGVPRPPLGASGLAPIECDSVHGSLQSGAGSRVFGVPVGGASRSASLRSGASASGTASRAFDAASSAMRRLDSAGMSGSGSGEPSVAQLASLTFAQGLAGGGDSSSSGSSSGGERGAAAASARRIETVSEEPELALTPHPVPAGLPDDDGVSSGCSGSGDVVQSNEAADRAWRADMAHLEVEGVLGGGGHGTVYLGTWRTLEVAIKTVVFEVRATLDCSGRICSYAWSSLSAARRAADAAWPMAWHVAVHQEHVWCCRLMTGGAAAILLLIKLHGRAAVGCTAKLTVSGLREPASRISCCS